MWRILQLAMGAEALTITFGVYCAHLFEQHCRYYDLERQIAFEGVESKAYLREGSLGTC